MQNKQEYYEEYVLGIKPEPNEKMVLGSIVHEMFANPNYDYKTALKNNNFTAKEFRVVEGFRLFKFPKKSVSEYKLSEKVVADCELIGYIDKMTKETVYEIKTSGSFWNKSRVEESLQLTIYSFLHTQHYKLEEPSPLVLVNFNTNNGKFVEFETKRTLEQHKEMLKLVRDVISEIKNLGWFEERYERGIQKGI